MHESQREWYPTKLTFACLRFGWSLLLEVGGGLGKGQAKQRKYTGAAETPTTNNNKQQQQQQGGDEKDKEGERNKKKKKKEKQEEDTTKTN